MPENFAGVLTISVEPGAPGKGNLISGTGNILFRLYQQGYGKGNYRNFPDNKFYSIANAEQLIIRGNKCC
jgi:hypothetical protein